MSLSTDISKDIKGAQKLRLPWWGVVCGIVGSFLCAWLFDSFGRLNLVLPVLNITAVLGLIIALKWRLRRYLWFWVALGIIAALHIPLLLFIPWTTKWIPALAIAGIDSIDFCGILWMLDAAARAMERRNAAEAG